MDGGFSGKRLELYLQHQTKICILANTLTGCCWYNYVERRRV